MGDLLYRTCSLQQLARGLPQCRWTYLASPQSAAVLENNPYLAGVLPIVEGENSWNLSAAGFSELRRRRFDVALCTNTLRHYPDFALAGLLGVPNRVGFIDKGMSGLINHPVTLDFPQSYPAYFRSLVASITSQSPNWDLKPQVFPSARHTSEAGAVWNHAGFSDSRPVLACALTTRQRKGALPPEVILSILRRARAELEFDIALCGSAEDRAQLETLARDFPFGVRIVAGELSVLGFAEFLSRCGALLTADSGPRHIGNAAGLPVFFTRNLSQLQVETGKYCDSETDLVPDGYELIDSSGVDQVAREIPVTSSAMSIIGALKGSALRE